MNASSAAGCADIGCDEEDLDRTRREETETDVDVNAFPFPRNVCTPERLDKGMSTPARIEDAAVGFMNAILEATIRTMLRKELRMGEEGAAAVTAAAAAAAVDVLTTAARAEAAAPAAAAVWGTVAWGAGGVITGTLNAAALTAAAIARAGGSFDDVSTGVLDAPGACPRPEVEAGG